ncbi:hypothetical protein Purlil1_5285 [Purpureocillium lilacinum]|uniref:OrdA protein n=1 Tax=Purpureocillium lilacinum TaxID=33203 RepID=A0ABR0C2L6_PURLI|nr:hypothetical protein Purlil1_5285 [Purpureocillium lilacinum]
MASSPWWYVIAILLFYVCYRFVFLHGRNRRRLPPGPKPLPIVGNMRDLPSPGAVEFQHWLKHKDDYGTITVTVMGMTLIIIHDKDAAHELLDKQSSNTSGRPSMVFANELCGYGSIVICQSYTPTFRHSRKLLHKELGTKTSASRLSSTSAATVLKMAYGYTVEAAGLDPLVELTDRMMAEFSQAAAPMAWPVDIIPALRYLPESMPCFAFKKVARRWRRSILQSAYIPYRFVVRQMAAHASAESDVSRLIDEFSSSDGSGLSDKDEDAIVWTAASLYGAAADTAVITLTAFTAAMIMFPEVQRTAQEEIDRVVGSDRLPTLEDRDRLPYVDALVKESLRWWPIAPMGFPHLTTAAVAYRGMEIPKGAFLLPAVWWFLHDPRVYSEPSSFDPARFLSPRNEPDPANEAFGYGRRICPGRFFADSFLWLNIARSLACFQISNRLDASGKKIEVDVKPQAGVLSYATDFEFEVTSRSEEHTCLIRRFEAENPLGVGDAALLGDEIA